MEVEPITEWQRPLPDAAFYTARSVEEALDLVSQHEGARFIAGGTSLVRFGRWGGNIPSTLVYIGLIPELKRIEARGDRIYVGAGVVHRQITSSPLLRERGSLLVNAAEEIAGPAVRNLATIGGNIYIQWDLVPPLLALDAQVHLVDRNGEQTVPLTELYENGNVPKVSPNQLIAGVSIATDLPHSSYQKIARRKAVSRAIVGAAVAMALDGDVCRDIRIGLGGVALFARRLVAAESLLRGQPLSDELVARAGDIAYQETADAYEDVETTPWYTREMARVMTERALNAAAGRPVL